MPSFVDEPTSASQRSVNPDESDLDPAAFLKSVRELSEKREREDAERYRKLEEEIERSRQERAARRAERARSISPEKANTNTSNALPSPTVSGSARSPPPITPPVSSSTTMDPNGSPTKEIPEFKGFTSSSKPKSTTPSTQSPAQMSETSESAAKPSPSASSLARSGTLSWQQRRPPSRGGSSRPLSMTSNDSSTQGRSTPAQEPEQSRDQIAASLGARDPSWFRQTADRGVGNAAYRKSKDEMASGDSVVSGRQGLPGMSRESSAEPVRERSPARSESTRSDAASRTGSIRDNGISSSRFSATRTSTTSSKPDLKSLIAADESQEKAAPMFEQESSVTSGEQSSLGRSSTMSSAQARLANAPDRPESPTKGMGGFVQSAMMKRSESVNKRWSAQPGPNISRNNSVASARSGYGGLAGSHSMPKLEPTPSSRETSNEPSSRPSSSSSNLTNLTLTQGKDDKDVFAKPALPSHSRSKSVASNYNTTGDEGHTSPPSSPSKRWSPTKSSWLESAISKPESPKPAAARNSQPSWMADIAKAKAQRANDSPTKPAEDQTSNSASPTKPAFGQGMLKRSESKDIVTSRTQTPRPPSEATSRPSSPSKVLGSSTLQRSESRNLEEIAATDSKTTSSREVQKPDDLPSPSKDENMKSSTETDAKVPIKAEETTPKDVSSAKSSRPEKPLEPVKSPPLSNTAKSKPETPPKPQTDFRGNLRSRAPTETKQQEAPEFLSKFGNLRKTQTQNYVAPDVLKNNITRGKAELTKTGGPVKTERRDEFKESLLAKRQQWKEDKEAGIVHERKVSGPPQTPQKPEALTQREALGRTGSTKTPSVAEQPKTATSEALARQRSLKQNPQADVSMPALEKQTSAPATSTTDSKPSRPWKQASDSSSTGKDGMTQPTETSKMAARFNPGLAGILARGPPPASESSNTPSRTESPAVPERSDTPRMSAPSEPSAQGQLGDMRKGRAKGPKKRKGAAREVDNDTSAATLSEEVSAKSPPTNATPIHDLSTSEEAASVEKPKPRAPPGSAASIMMASLQKSSAPTQQTTETQKPTSPFKPTVVASPNPTADKPMTPAKSPAISSTKPVDEKPVAPTKSLALASRGLPPQEKAMEDMPGTQKQDIPEFAGFGSVKKQSSAVPLEENKENAGESSPSVRSSAMRWGRPPSPKKSEAPQQIKLPSRKDEEAAMRSAGLLASSPSRPGSSNGLGIAVKKNDTVETPPASADLPPKPTKPSRAVSGRAQQTSPNASTSQLSGRPENEAARRLVDTFGSNPRFQSPLAIDTQSVIASRPHSERTFRTVRKSVQLVRPDGSLQQLPQPEEYTFFEESVYICSHAYTIGDSAKKTEIFVWIGDSSSQSSVDQAQTVAKKMAKEAGNAFVHSIRQGYEPPGFLQAMGGILVTRRASREAAAKQYMLRGRKHLGQIVFDEVDFGIDALCSGFAYLISYPVTLQETRLYLWKGSCCSSDEVSGARLAAMDLSETGEIIEVDDGAEFSSFLKIFEPGTTKTMVPKPSDLWQQKAVAPNNFAVRLFTVQQAETKPGFFTSMFTRRPSRGNISPARDQDEIKVEAKELSPFTQADLEADGIYLLDAYSELYVLFGPVFPSQPESIRNALLGQTLLFASDYTLLAASTEDRPSVPKAFVLFSGVAQDLKLLFRHWDESRGLWGTGGLMAGSQGSRGSDASVVALDEVLELVCKA